MPLNTIRRTLVTAVLLMSASAAWAQNQPGSALLDFNQAQLPSVNAIGAAMAPAGEGKIRLTAQGDGESSISFPARADNWTLSGDLLKTKVKNVGSLPLALRFSIANEGAKNLTDNCQMPILLSPDEEKELELRVVQRPEDPTYAPFKPFMMYFKNINVRDNSVDAKAIKTISFSIDRPQSGMAVEIGTVTQSGKLAESQTPFFPFIDRYGQYIHSNWPGKIRSDEDFNQRRDEEARERAEWSGPKDWNEYGGWAAGPQLEATGSFRVTKHEGKWWLVDPTGRLFWSNGPTGVGFGGDLTPVTDRENWFRDMPAQDDPQWGSFYRKGRGATYMYYKEREWTGYDVARANLVHKYGPDYENIVSNVSHERLRSWGFNTMANWSDSRIYLQHRTPYTVAIHYDAPLIHYRMQDIYHPDWEKNVRNRMMREKETTANDPFNIGYFVDNERWWGWRPRAAAIGEETLKNPPERHAKIKFVALLKAKYETIEKLNEAWGSTHESWDALLAYTKAPDMKNEKVMQDCGDFGMMFAERYFTIVKDAVKQAAPNKLYLGARFHGHIDKAVVALAGKYCDVISYNIYDNPPNGRINQYNDLDLPMMSTEWGVGSDPTQTPFRGEKLDIDPTERSRLIEQYMRAAIRHPNMVGAHFFQYRDQPISGRPDGEATLRGFVNIVDTPNFELVQTNRRIGYSLYETRANAK
jgi:hypothetical protein